MPAAVGRSHPTANAGALGLRDCLFHRFFTFARVFVFANPAVLAAGDFDLRTPLLGRRRFYFFPHMARPLSEYAQACKSIVCLTDLTHTQPHRRPGPTQATTTTDVTDTCGHTTGRWQQHGGIIAQRQRPPLPPLCSCCSSCSRPWPRPFGCDFRWARHLWGRV